jgi:FkbM family methyltransferase
MCDYFILTKSDEQPTNNNTKNSIISLNEIVYILPKNNIGYYIKNGLFENNLIEWCKQFCDKTKNMLDIGAHTGTYTVSLAKNCNHIYAFEPQKQTFYSLCGSIALSNIKNVTCLNYGLGTTEQVGKQLLNIVSLDGGGSSLHVTGNILQKEEIEVRTLDSFNIDNIGFIKIDVEENELQVLLCSRNTLKNSNYPKILFEMNIENTQLLNFFQELGYDVLSIRGYNNMFLAVNKLNV